MDEGHLGWRDVLLPAAMLVMGCAEAALLGTDGWVTAIGLEATCAVALVFRRSHTSVAAPVAAVVLMLIPLTGTQMNELATPLFFYIVAIYSLGRYLTLRGGIAALALTLALVAVDISVVAGGGDVTDVLFVASLAVPPYVFGRMTARLAEQSQLVVAQSEQLRDQAVREERDRIARELHDVIAHSISVMVVQTAAAQDLVRRDPDRAAGLLQTVADTGRTALAETGRLLHLIRDDADELGLSPAPGLSDLPALLASVRDSGLEVESRLDLPATPLPGGIDVSAYRVVQELLTNALKHGAGHVRLEVTAAGEVLRIACANPVGRVAGDGSGLGLQGVAERVSVLGGRLDPRCSDGRFLVDVEIPLPARAEGR